MVLAIGVLVDGDGETVGDDDEVAALEIHVWVVNGRSRGSRVHAFLGANKLYLYLLLDAPKFTT